MNSIVWTFVSTALLACSIVAASDEPPRGDLLIIQGSPGEEEYGKLFSIWSQRWQSAAERGRFRVVVSSPNPEEKQKVAISGILATYENETALPLWIVMIGHGTFNGREAKFNLAGEDLSAKELDTMLAKVARTTVIINCSSSSAPFLDALSQENRIILTSTRSGEQVNFSRFGEYISQAIGETTSDLDKDKQTSLLEAFLSASRKTLEFYESDGRIPTENALLDDNGDGKGTRATAFRGVRAIAKPEEDGILLDGFRAHQLHLIPNDAEQSLSPEQIAQRNELERKIELLRLEKNSLEEDDYYRQLEALFLQLAEILLLEDQANPGES